MVNASSKKRSREESSTSDESENEYQVEAIVDKRTRGKRVQYLLKWIGYDDADNTWEDVNNMNCPDLVKEFEESLKKKANKSEAKSKKRTTGRPKKAKIDDDNIEEQRTDENQPIEIDDQFDSSKTNDQKKNDEVDSQTTKLLSSTCNDEPSTPNVPTNKRLRSTSKSESIVGVNIVTDHVDQTEISVEGEKGNEVEMIETNKIDENIEEPNRKRATDIAEQNDESSSNLRLRITPNSESSISCKLNDSDNNNNNTLEKSSADQTNNQDQDVTEIINEDEEPVEKIEAVKNDNDGISFRIRLIGEKEATWISAKIANRKYPQSVISFWESHVEFT